MTAPSSPPRLIIAGGGLAGCLTALAFAERRPEVPLLLVEGADKLGGNHVWSFFGSDVAREDWSLVEPVVSARWEEYEVRFPRLRRRLTQPYYSIKSERLDVVVRERLGPDRLRLGASIAEVAPDGIRLQSGERLKGSVIDARGAGPVEGLELGWQKFVGLDFAFDAPHGIERPVIMDANVEQVDGYRFIYLLPFSPTELLVEDTYYSDTSDLDVRRIRQRIAAHVAEMALPEGRVVREETGVLPVVIGGQVESLLGQSREIPMAGMRGAFFHPTTGYSLPDAVRVAALLARQERLDPVSLKTLLDGEAKRLWRGRGFYRMLNRMLFRAALPNERYRVLQRFYGLSPALIGRFYAGKTTLMDRVRILVGRPPVPVGRAVKALLGRKAS
jgi:lycopene beta-cyclase